MYRDGRSDIPYLQSIPAIYKDGNNLKIGCSTKRQTNIKTIVKKKYFYYNFII